MTVKETKELIELINRDKGIYEKYSLIGMGGGNYGLYMGDFAKSIGKWIAKGTIKHIFQCVKEERTETIKEDFILF